MDINQNQQTNTFLKGMDTDTSDALINDLQYREARNLRLTTNIDSNDGELHMIEGVSDCEFTSFFSRVIATTSIGNCGVIIGCKAGETGWSIYKFDKDIKESSKLIRVFGQCNEFLEEPLSLVTRQENQNIKLYIASKNHSILSINLNHDDYVNNAAPNTLKYLSVNDTVFAKPLTYEVQDGGGSFEAPVIQYAYRLYKLGQQSTQTSPLTKLISLYNTDTLGYSQNDFILKTITLHIDTTNIPEFIDYVQIFRISYVENGQQPIVDIVFDEPLLPTFVDVGLKVKTISVAEFIATTNIQIKPLLIEAKNNYLFAANVTYEQNDIDELFKGSTLTYTIIHNTYKIDINNRIIEGTYGRSLRRGESYRYGVVFYTKDGKHSSVQCVTDVIDIPEGNVIVGITKDENNNPIYEVERTGIKFTVTIPQLSLSNCEGYEIVRCERTFADTTNIAQGIIGDCFNLGLGTKITNSYISPFMSLYRHCYTSNRLSAITSSGIEMFGCPEYVYNTDEFINNVKSVKNIIRLKDLSDYKINSEESVINGETAINVGEIYFVNHYMRPDLSPNKSTHHGTPNHRFVDTALIYPVENANNYTANNHKITDINFMESPEYDNFSDGEDILIQNDTFVVGNANVMNWFVPDFYTDSEFHDDDDIRSKFAGSDFNNYYSASGKKAVLLAIDVPKETATPIGLSSSGHNYGGTRTGNSDGTESTGFLNITVTNLYKTQNNKYGGNSSSAKNSCIFHSYGNYKDIMSTVDTIDIYDGDCYIGCFEYNSSHWWDSSVYNSLKCTVRYIVPLETSIDLTKTNGDLFSRMPYNTPPLFQDVPVNIEHENMKYIQKKHAYLYNSAYGVTPNIMTYVPITYTKLSTDTYNNRIYYSERKQDGESIDSWYQFKSANYIDTDSKFGEITNLRLFKNSLIFWQEHATGVLSVNERTILQDANDTNIILGNGDVLQRYDYLSTVYGMKKDDMCDAQSDISLYWVDSWFKTLIQYNGGLQINILNKNKNVSNYINKTIIDKPKLLWDSKNREILFNLFRDYMSNGDTLAYSEAVQAFTSIYDLPFEHTIEFPNRLFFIENSNIYDRKNDFSPEYAINTHKNKLLPCIKYIVNKNSTYNKVFDIQTFGGRFYGGSNILSENKPNLYKIKGEHNNTPLEPLRFTYATPLKQHSFTTGESVSNYEYDYRLTIPRATEKEFGGRVKGKTMQCEFKSTTNNTDFSLLYIITKFRMSWA